jgi:hypothetical protein
MILMVLTPSMLNTAVVVLKLDDTVTGTVARSPA